MRFGPYHHPHTVEEQRAEGFATGLTWRAKWTPGGPPVDRDHRPWNPDGTRSDRAWAAYCAHTEACAAAWLAGFHAAVAERASASAGVPIDGPNDVDRLARAGCPR